MCFLLHSRHALFNRRGRVLARHVKQKNNSECLGVVPFIFIFRNVPVFDFLLAEIACATWQKNKKDILCVVLFACVIVGMRLSWLCNLVCLLALSLSLSLSRKHTHTHTHAHPHAPALGIYFNAPLNGCIIFIIVHYSDLNQGLSACWQFNFQI